MPFHCHILVFCTYFYQLFIGNTMKPFSLKHSLVLSLDKTEKKSFLEPCSLVLFYSAFLIRLLILKIAFLWDIF